MTDADAIDLKNRLIDGLQTQVRVLTEYVESSEASADRIIGAQKELIANLFRQNESLKREIELRKNVDLLTVQQCVIYGVIQGVQLR